MLRRPDDAIARAMALAGAQVVAATGDGPQPLVQYANRRDAFWVDVLGERPHELQREANALLDSGCKRLYISSGTGVGKTVWAGRTAVHFLATRRNAIVIVIATSWDQVVNQLMREIRSCYAKARRALPGVPTQARVDVGPRWFLLGVSPRQPETLAGYHPSHDIAQELLTSRERWLAMTDLQWWEALQRVEQQSVASGHGRPAVMLVKDEAAGISDEMHDAGDGILTGPDDVSIMLSNPTRTSGRAFETWQRSPPTSPSRVCFAGEEADHVELIAMSESLAARGREDAARPEGDRSPWTTLRWTAFDAPPQLQLDRWVRIMRQECGPAYQRNPRYMVRVLALPPEGAEDAIFPMGLLEDALASTPAGGGRHMGVDLGFGGGDPSVATLEVNGVVAANDRWNVEGPVLDDLATANRIIDLAEGWRVPPRNIHIDASTAGVGVVGTLRRLGWWVDAVLPGSAPAGDWRDVLGPTPAGIRNRREELMWIGRERLRRGLAKIPDSERYGRLWSDLVAWRRDKNAPDEFRPESKKVYKARERKSPDDGDSWLYSQSRVDPGRARVRHVRVTRRGLAPVRGITRRLRAAS